MHYIIKIFVELQNKILIYGGKRRRRRRRTKIRIIILKMSRAMKNNQPINNRIPEKLKK
jgi:hypothetical protein